MAHETEFKNLDTSKRDELNYDQHKQLNNS